MTAQSLETKYCSSISMPSEKDHESNYGDEMILNVFLIKKLEQIMRPLGLKMSFIVRVNNNIKVAKATYYNNVRYIDINDAFITKLGQSDIETNMILAHEIGHHLNFDFADYKIYESCAYRNEQHNCKKWQERESAADTFSGSTLYKLGAERATCARLIGQLLKEQEIVEGPRTHPNSKLRLNAFWAGYDSAESLLKDLKTNDTVTAEYYRNQALIAAYETDNSLSANPIEEVLEYYTLAIEKNPNIPLLYAERGYFYNRNSDFEAAQFDFDKAIQLDGNNPNFKLMALEVQNDDYFLEYSAIELEKSASSTFKNLEKEINQNKILKNE